MSLLIVLITCLEGVIITFHSFHRWANIRVFISSTFFFFFGERDLLTRFVFPELQARAKKQFINLTNVDLRWGITAKESTENQ